LVVAYFLGHLVGNDDDDDDDGTWKQLLAEYSKYSSVNDFFLCAACIVSGSRPTEVTTETYCLYFRIITKNRFEYGTKTEKHATLIISTPNSLLFPEKKRLRRHGGGQYSYRHNQIIFKIYNAATVKQIKKQR